MKFIVCAEIAYGRICNSRFLCLRSLNLANGSISLKSQFLDERYVDVQPTVAKGLIYILATNQTAARLWNKSCVTVADCAVDIHECHLEYTYSLE